MKLLTTLVLIISLCCMIFAGCGEGNINDVKGGTATASDKATTPSDTIPSSQKIPSDDFTVDEDNYVTTADPGKYGVKWVNMWLEDKYGSNMIKDAKIEYISRAVFDQFSDGYQISPILYSVSFSSQGTVPNAEKQPDGSYTFKVLVVTTIEGSKAVLLGILGPGEFSENDAITSAYELISKNHVYSSSLKPFPKAYIPGEFTQIDLGLISGGRNTTGRYTRILPGNILAVVCLESTGSNNTYDTGISLYDLSNRKTVGYVEIGDYNIVSTKVSGENLIINALDSNSKMHIFKVDPKGNLSTEEYRDDINYTVYSPDGSKYAYSDKGSIYAADVKDNNPKLLITGNNSDGQDRIYYYPFAWYDNSILVYGIGGYEWSNGCGVIDVDTGKDTFFEQLKGSYPIALKDGKFYTITAEDIESYFDPYVIDLSDKAYTMEKLFKDKAFVEGIGSCCYSFSPDGAKIAILKNTDGPDKKSTLYICSSEDGSVLKNYEFRASALGNPQYLDFFEDGRIAIYTERYAFSPDLIYIVDLS